MPNITYNDHPDSGLLDGSERFPAWQSGSAVKVPTDDLFRLRLNPSLVSAAGTDQSGATTLSNTYWVHQVSTVGPGAGVKLVALSGFRGVEFRYIICLGTVANDLLIYPPVGGKLNDQAVNSPLIIPIGVIGMFICLSTTDWRSIG